MKEENELPLSQPLEGSYLKKYKKPILVSVAVITLIVILVAPIIPIKYIVTQTRTIKLRYSSQLYHKTIAGMDVGPWLVDVINKDSIGGFFSITMNKWRNLPYPYKPSPSNPFIKIKKELEDTSTQSLFIDADSTQTFYVPKDWIILGFMYSFTYSVSAPTTQETYNVTKTEYKSIIALIGNS